VYQDEHESHE